MLKDILIFTDVETGGLNPKQHSLLTVAFVIVQNNEVVNKKEWKVKHPTYHVTTNALEVNGIHLVEHDKEAIDREQVGSEMIEFLSQYCSEEKKGILVGQNTVFDKNFIEAFLLGLIDLSNWAEYKKIISHRYIDLISITAFLNMAGVIETEGLKLDNVIKALNLEVKARHTAMDDAEVTWQGMSHMLQLVKQS